MRKMLATFLAATLSFTLSIPAFAAKENVEIPASGGKVTAATYYGTIQLPMEIYNVDTKEWYVKDRTVTVIGTQPWQTTVSIESPSLQKLSTSEDAGPSLNYFFAPSEFSESFYCEGESFNIGDDWSGEYEYWKYTDKGVDLFLPGGGGVYEIGFYPKGGQQVTIDPILALTPEMIDRFLAGKSIDCNFIDGAQVFSDNAVYYDYPGLKEILTANESTQTTNTTEVGNQPSSWAKTEVMAALCSNIANDLTSDTNVNYQSSIPRADFCYPISQLLSMNKGKTVTALIEKNQAKSQFTDCDLWLWPWIDLAASNGIISGSGDGTFQPDSFLTREQAAKIVTLTYEALKPGSYDKNTDYYSSIAPADAAQVSDWAKNYVGYAIANGLMTGSDGFFAPQDTLSFEQADLIVYRLAKVLGTGNSYFMDTETAQTFVDLGLNLSISGSWEDYTAVSLCNNGSAVTSAKVLSATVNGNAITPVAITEEEAGPDAWKASGGDSLIGAWKLNAQVEAYSYVSYTLELELTLSDGSTKTITAGQTFTVYDGYGGLM
ncbi:MAG: S-layer homology domain-containing protein [Bacillota bacterium]|nr:S-layer homology domain-containing protein [Bacillota bacterium]